MANGDFRITEEGWKKMEPEEKFWTLYETIIDVKNKVDKLEFFKWPSLIVTGIMSMIGGASIGLVIHLYKIKPF